MPTSRRNLIDGVGDFDGCCVALLSEDARTSPPSEHGPAVGPVDAGESCVIARRLAELADGPGFHLRERSAGYRVNGLRELYGERLDDPAERAAPGSQA